MPHLQSFGHQLWVTGTVGWNPGLKKYPKMGSLITREYFVSLKENTQKTECEIQYAINTERKELTKSKETVFAKEDQQMKRQR